MSNYNDETCYRLTVEIETEMDPSELLDALQLFATDLAPGNGQRVEDTACVEEVAPVEAVKPAPTLSTIAVNCLELVGIEVHESLRPHGHVMLRDLRAAHE